MQDGIIAALRVGARHAVQPGGLTPTKTHEDCMTTLRKPTLTAATLMLALAASVALAQTAQPKPASLLPTPNPLPRPRARPSAAMRPPVAS